jgi:hypothetical protein
VGSLVGAVTGSMIGLATESGMLRGAGIGAISGAVFAIEVAESSRDLWHSGDSSVWSLIYMVSIAPFRVRRENLDMDVCKTVSSHHPVAFRASSWGPDVDDD